MPKTNPAIERTRDEVLEDGVILCARMNEGDAIVDACRAAIRGGLRVLEITLTTPGAFEAIGALAADGDAVVGAGTVLTVEQAREVKAAGGRFVLSPVFDPAVIAEAHRLEMLAVPGTASPTEILAAYHSGARLIKVFPIGALGGPTFLRAVRGPFPDIPLAATNGPTAESLGDYFAAGALTVGLGGEVFHEGYTLASIEAAARRVRQAVQTYRASRE
jgi:2-dehydro-3-deoxyphosphogluconate aldolase/(4S)-4-hydroxy-2-oxoglutarate aldolase